MLNIMIVSAAICLLGLVVGLLGFDYKNKNIQRLGEVMIWQMLPVFIIIFVSYIWRIV